MKMTRPAYQWVLPAAVALTAWPAYATVYLSTEQAQQAIFPGLTFTANPLHLDDAQAKTIEKRSRVNVRRRDVHAWRTQDGGWFFVDEVVGKHEFITYAVGLTAAGAVKQVEILEYRESFGQDVRNEAWRHQFVGKTVADPLQLEGDIKNISGATLSSRHVTDGVKRLLVTWDVALRGK
jgi:Na+-translocating ferredoxin:NAD+ oxidoreductase RnfG subunit